MVAHDLHVELEQRRYAAPGGGGGGKVHICRGKEGMATSLNFTKIIIEICGKFNKCPCLSVVRIRV